MEKGNADVSSAGGALISSDPGEDCELLESLLWTQDDGYFVLGHHRDRVQRSAMALGFQLELDEFDRQLRKVADMCETGAHKVRVRISRDGSIHAESHPISSHDAHPAVRVGMSRFPVNSSDPFLYHKTTQRTIYERAVASRSDCDDVILYNERGEVTESCVANVVVQQGGRHLTPAIRCGLLAGTFRARLIDEGTLEESTISIEQLTRCDRLYLINSVRKWIRTEWVDTS